MVSPTRPDGASAVANMFFQDGPGGTSPGFGGGLGLGSYENSMQSLNPDMSKLFANFDMAKTSFDQEMDGRLGNLEAVYAQNNVELDSAFAQLEKDRQAAIKQQEEGIHDLKMMDDPIRHGKNGEALAGLGKKALHNPIGAAVDVVTNPIGFVEDVGGAIGDVFTGKGKLYAPP